MLSVSDVQLLKFVGLDAFLMVRYVRFCLKVCLFSTALGTGALVPLYMRGADWEADAEAERSEAEREAELGDDDQVAEFERYNRFTLLNVAHTRNGLLWLAAIVAAYANLLQLYVLARNELRVFRKLRLLFYVHGDPAVPREALHTVMVTNLPPWARREGDGLGNFFEELFPGEVVGVNVARPPDAQLCRHIARRKTAVEQLEMYVPTLHPS